MRNQYPDVNRGRLSEDEKREIARLAEAGRKSGRIALTLKRHPATINSYMVTNGFKACGTRPIVYVRNGRPVAGFSSDEDVLIEALSLLGFKLRVIAEAAHKHFGHRRTPATISFRLKMLASRHEMADV